MWPKQISREFYIQSVLSLFYHYLIKIIIYKNNTRNTRFITNISIKFTFAQSNKIRMALQTLTKL